MYASGSGVVQQLVIFPSAAAVDLDEISPSVLFPQSAGLLDLIQHFKDEALSRKAHVHCHDGEQVNPAQKIFHTVQRSGGVEHQPLFAAQFFDLVHQPKTVTVDHLRVKGDAGRPRPGHGVDQKVVGARCHKMHIHRQVTGSAHRLQKRRRQGQIFAKMPVHDVKVQRVEVFSKISSCSAA